MTNIDVKTVGELFKFVGPTEEHRQKFSPTLPGNLPGQAVLAVSLFVLHCLLRALVFLGKPAKSALPSRRALSVKRDGGADHGLGGKMKSILQGETQWPPNPSM